MARRSRLRTEKRLAALEAMLQAQPTTREAPAVALAPEVMGEVLAILEGAMGRDRMRQWLQGTMRGTGSVDRWAEDDWGPFEGWVDGEHWDPDHPDEWDEGEDRDQEEGSEGSEGE